MNAKGVQQHIGIPHNQEGMLNQAIAMVWQSQMLRRSFLIDQCHLNPIEYSMLHQRSDKTKPWTDTSCRDSQEKIIKNKNKNIHRLTALCKKFAGWPDKVMSYSEV